jgi:hypothetical protein
VPTKKTIKNLHTIVARIDHHQQGIVVPRCPRRHHRFGKWGVELARSGPHRPHMPHQRAVARETRPNGGCRYRPPRPSGAIRGCRIGHIAVQHGQATGDEQLPRALTSTVTECTHHPVVIFTCKHHNEMATQVRNQHLPRLRNDDGLHGKWQCAGGTSHIAQRSTVPGVDHHHATIPESHTSRRVSSGVTDNPDNALQIARVSNRRTDGQIKLAFCALNRISIQQKKRKVKRINHTQNNIN